MTYTELVDEYLQKAGEKALKHCIEQGLLAWYVVGSCNTGRLSASRYIERGPEKDYKVLLNLPYIANSKIELLSPEEAKRLTY